MGTRRHDSEYFGLRDIRPGITWVDVVFEFSYYKITLEAIRA